MNNQSILQALSGIEAALYYRRDGSDAPEGLTPEEIETAHAAARALLEYWHRVTGETLRG